MTNFIEKWTDVSPTAAGNLLDPQRPVVGRQVELASGLRIRPHRHRRAQLLHAPRGPLRVVTEYGSWIVPADQAVWIPGDVEHSVLANAPLSIYTLFIDADSARKLKLPRQCRVLNLSPLMRELILRVVTIGVAYPVGGAAQRLARVALDELATLPSAPLHLPLARDRRVRRLMEALIDDPGAIITLPDETFGITESSQILGISF
jgi:quercetin dioxygenase-like cupin family protein